MKLETQPSTAGKIARFAIVGGLSTVAYGACTWLAVEVLSMPPLLATLAGYLVVIPLNFGLQRSFTFRSTGMLRAQVPRFLLVHACNMAASFAAMWCVVEWIGADYRWGIAATMTLVPVLVFVALDAWVFGSGRHARAQHGGGR